MTDYPGTHSTHKDRQGTREIRAAFYLSFPLAFALFLLPLTMNRVKRTWFPNTETEREKESGYSTESVQNAAFPEETEAQETVPEVLEPESDAGSGVDEATEEAASSAAGERDGERIIRVLLHENGTTADMDLGTYVSGVLRGEMPASFEPEALKAQAVAARTYTRYMLAGGGKHGDLADICTDSHCCQAYVSADKARDNWGNRADEYEAKIENAVAETDGQILLYDGEPILAVFHSSSAGLTRTAEDVWSGGQPYLRPVSSPETAEQVPNYYSRVEFRKAEFCEKMKKAYPGADFSAPMGEWIRQDVRDEAGSIVTVCVGGVTMQGSKLRSALGLRSACFTWEVQGDKLIFYVTGFGHGVGLSQYGANQMAADGADYQEILTHYYTGVKIGKYLQ